MVLNADHRDRRGRAVRRGRAPPTRPAGSTRAGSSPSSPASRKADSRLDAEIRVGDGARRARRSCCACTARSASTPTRWSRRCSCPTSPWSPGGPTSAPAIAGRAPARRARPAPGHRRGGRRVAARAPEGPGGGLPAGRHRLRAGPGPPRGARCSPPRWTSRTRQIIARRGRGRAGQPDRGPDRRLAGASGCRRAGRPGRLRRPGHHRGGVRHAGRATSAVTRTDGRTATLAWPGRADRMVALHRRDTAELLAEELRRLDPDEVYAETLATSTCRRRPGCRGRVRRRRRVSVPSEGHQ